MSLWAIQVTPIMGRGKPWIHHGTVASLRSDAWAKFRENATPIWHKTIKKRQRAGLLRAVKVTIELKEENHALRT